MDGFERRDVRARSHRSIDVGRSTSVVLTACVIAIASVSLAACSDESSAGERPGANSLRPEGDGDASASPSDGGETEAPRDRPSSDAGIRDAVSTSQGDVAPDTRGGESDARNADVSGDVARGDVSHVPSSDVHRDADPRGRADADASRSADTGAPAPPLTLTFASWNIHSPSETETRASYLARTADQLKADVVALQEIGKNPSLGQIFEPSRYETLISRQQRGVYQNTGFAVDRDLTVTRHADYKEVDVDYGQRRGVDVTIQFRRHSLRVLSVHLNSGCQRGYGPDEECQLLEQQARALKRWIEARERNGEDYAILGDFNRTYDANSAFWRILRRADRGMIVKSKGKNPECHRDDQYDQFIDHLVFDGDVRQWLELGSFRELTYDQALFGNPGYEQLSDHCPISVELTER